MLRNPCRVELLKASDVKIIDRICDLLRNVYDLQVSKFFIYHDPCYKKYFRYALTDSNQCVFYCSGPDGELHSFAHFKKEPSSVSLVNFITDPAYQRKGNGSSLLFQAVEKLLSDEEWNAKYLTLNVFKKNKTALNWYMRLGMKVDTTSFWYDLSDFFNEIKPGFKEATNNFQFDTDRFGYTQLFHDGLPIAYLVNNNCLTIKAEIEDELLNYIPRYYRDLRFLSVCWISKKIKGFPLIDQSFHLSVPLNKLSSFRSL